MKLQEVVPPPGLDGIGNLFLIGCFPLLRGDPPFLLPWLAWVSLKGISVLLSVHNLINRELCTSTNSRQHPSHDSSLSCVQVGLLNKDKVSHLHSLCVQMTVLCKVSVSLPCKKTSPGPGPGEALAWDEAPGGCSTSWFGWYWEFI